VREYYAENNALLSRCLADIELWAQDRQLKHCLELAFHKALKVDQPRPVPPLMSWVLAQDLGYGEEPWAWPLAVACAYLYTAADLLDDIQDHDPKQPVLQQVSPEQAMNVSNSLLMGAYRAISESELAPDRQLAMVKLFTQMGSTMSLGQFWDLKSTNQRNQEQTPEQVVRAKSGAEFSGFLTIAPCALGLETETYHQLGEEIGTLAQILSDYFDIWLVPDQQTLSQDLLVLKNSFPLFWARKDPNLGALIDHALAGKNDLPAKQFQLRRLLAQTHTAQAFSDFLERSQTQLSKLFAALPSLPNVQYLAYSHCEQAEQLIAGLKKLRDITHDTQPWQLQRNATKAMNMAISYLQFIPEFRDVWEVQRWGFLGEPELFGDIFNPLLVLEALNACGIDIQQPLQKILQKSAHDGWHYYSNTHKIPTDTDDFGQILHLVATLPREQVAPLLQQPLELLMANLNESGMCPTWLADEQIHVRENINKTWFGNECIAVMANLYYGLACYDPHLFSSQISNGAHYLVSQYQPELFSWRSSHYISSIYTSYLVARMLKKQESHFDFTNLINHLLDIQLLDGSWQQSPQETAFAVLFLLQVKKPHNLNESELLSLQRAQSFIIENQLFDGSWPGEGLFFRPGNENRHEVFTHNKLTSAYCLRALQQLAFCFNHR
jgi:geranylgeranyl pyrophosphate synthase